MTILYLLIIAGIIFHRYKQTTLSASDIPLDPAAFFPLLGVTKCWNATDGATYSHIFCQLEHWKWNIHYACQQLHNKAVLCFKTMLLTFTCLVGRSAVIVQLCGGLLSNLKYSGNFLLRCPKSQADVASDRGWALVTNSFTREYKPLHEKCEGSVS